MRKVPLIEVKVTDPLRGCIHHSALGRHLLAAERAPGIWCVRDGEFDFTFTDIELEQEEWIELVERHYEDTDL